MADHMQFIKGNLQCNVSFTTLVQYWEVNLVTSLFDLLYFIILRQGDEDKIWWIPSKRRKFEVRSFYHALTFLLVPHFLGKIFEELRFPRVAFFASTAALRKILTLDNLRKRKIIVVDLSCMCKRSVESINHLILHYEVAKELWVLTPVFLV